MNIYNTFLYDIVFLVIVFLGCISIWEIIKKWSESKLTYQQHEYFTVFVAVILVFVFLLIINQSRNKYATEEPEGNPIERENPYL
jgi:dolichyl-phosphate-mannose--protein O-mannosyl transferase